MTKETWARVVAAVAVIAYMAFHLFTYARTPGDHGLYALASRWLSDGILPYRDFAFAHPPLRLLLAWPIVRSASLSPEWVVLIPLVCHALAAGVVFRAMGREHGPGAALLAVCAFCGMGQAMVDGATFYGLGPVVLGSALAYDWGARGLHGRAGLALAVAGLSSAHMVPLVAGPALVAALSGRRGLLRFALGLGVLPAVMAVLGLAIPGFFEQTIGFHATKTGVTRDVAPVWILLTAVETSGALLMLAAIRAVLCASAATRTSLALATTVSLVAYLAALMVFRSVHDYYLLAVGPAVALGGVSGGVLLAQWLSGRVPGPRRPRALGALGVLLAASVLVTSVELISNGFTRRATDARADRAISEMSAQVDRLLPPGTGLIGDTSIVPWIVLETGRPLSGRLLDLNHKRFRTGLLEPERVIAAATADGLGGVVTVADQGIELIPEFMALLERDYEPVVLEDSEQGLRRVTLWRPPQRSLAELSP